MKKNLIYLFISVLTLSVITSCRKDAFEGNETGESGTTWVRFLNKGAKAPLNELFFTPFTDVKTIALWDLKREAHSNSSLNSTLTATLEADQAAIDAYNTEHNTDFDLLPESIYTVDAPGYTKTATGFTVNYGSGEFSKPFNIKLNGSQYDLSKKYAIAFKITTITGDGQLTKVTGEKTIMVTIGIKNKYDGVYELTGYHNRAPYNFPFKQTVELRTLDATSVSVYWPAVNSLGHPIGTGPDIENDYNWYGAAIAPAFTFDLSTDKVTGAYNLGGATVISLYGAADGSDALENSYDPSSKTIKVSWKYSNNAARAFFDTFTFVKERE